ncbi:uncharacterized protein J4E78_009936 [Alternaria triticimaculans]|uniref:uncharacterized protein n=1 Tax=Alternaria triticimaculans TaxID=297637 RepID=UPI0020C3E8CB|nr:uncharacterized protein J4E78_009936 [Alternaria triticimaculans]KAI4643466.1 hypothetical protein J4E78_009936 [Alternaria triticimaculans]
MRFYLVSLLSFVPSTVLAYHPEECPSNSTRHIQYPTCLGLPGVYLVKASEGMGLGVFAAHDIDIGDVVMRETPVLKIRLPKLANGSPYPMAAVAMLLQEQFDTLSLESQEEVLSLTHQTNPVNSDSQDTLGTIFRNNAYNTGDQVGLFPKIARINHSCRPNTSYYWSEKLNKRIVYATRKIKAGEEFFVSYISLLLSREDRQKQLDRYGFQCHCEACAHEQAAQIASDNRRITIKNAFSKFEPQMVLTAPQSKAGKRLARKDAEVSIQLAGLVEEEGLADYYAKAYRIAAISHARVEDWATAARWANRAYEIRYMEDPDSKSTLELHHLTSSFISNWETELRSRDST